MKSYQFLFRASSLCVLMASLALLFQSCEGNTADGAKWDDSVVGTATLSGVVKDTFGNLLADVTVSCMKTDSKREVVGSVLSGADGSFSLQDVPSNARFVTFHKDGFATVAYTIAKDRFAQEDNIVLNPELEFSTAVITGVVLNGETVKPMSGVVVSNGVKTATTDSDGKFRIEGLTINAYTLTYSTSEDSYKREVLGSDFIDGVAQVPTVRLGGSDVFPGLSWQEMADSKVWYANDYYGCTGGFGEVNFDWSSGYLSAFPYVGYFRYEAEGCAFEIRGKGSDKGWFGMTDEGDQDVLNAFLYGRKRIEEGNKVMSLNIRTHGSQEIYFGIQVLNLTDGETTARKAGVHHYTGGNYNHFSFDLSDYVGKDIAFAFGPYFYKGSGGHLCIRRVTFAPTALGAGKMGFTFPTGTPVTGLGENWHLTKEEVTSLTVNPGVSFSGQNQGQSRDDVQRTHNPGGQQGYSGWNGTNHLMNSWGLKANNRNVEPINGEGYTIKARGGRDAGYDAPETYIYSRFNISSFNDLMTIRVRNFSGTVPTVFRVTAVTDDGVAKALAPVENTASQASAVEGGNGCWKFIHESGAGNPKDYAAFKYDLKEFTGKNVVIAVSVHKGDVRDGEQKLCFYGIDME